MNCGFYWVKYRGNWTISYYDEGVNKWYINGLEHRYEIATFDEIGERIYKNTTTKITHPNGLTENVEALLREQPDLINEPKLLEKAYWEKYESIKIEGDWQNTTSAESIRRTWRRLVENNKIQISPERKLKSIQQEKNYRKLYKPVTPP